MKHQKPYGCGKRRFVTRRGAKKFIRSRNDQTGNRVYRCDCGFWHTTSVNADSTRYFRERKRDA